MQNDRYRIKGTTDDVTTCECCGRNRLKRTVALMPLDADGNEDGEVGYYGTGCAATLLRRTNHAVTTAARAAQNQWEGEATVARERLAAYEPVEFASIHEQAQLYYGRNPHMRNRGVKASEEIAYFLAHARSVLAAAV